MTKPKAYIHNMSAVTPLGLDARQSAASVRAGLSRSMASSIYDKHFEPVVLSLLPDDVLPALADDLQKEIGLTARQTRLLRLAGFALPHVVSGMPQTRDIPLFLAGPEPLPDKLPDVSADFLPRLIQQTAIPLNEADSHVFALGRAAGLVALEAGLSKLAEGVPYVLVGGVDSYLDLYLLSILDAEDRILGPQVTNGFIPGEGAAFLLLGKDQPPWQGVVGILGAAQGFEKGHLYSEETYKGDGLAETFGALFKDMANGFKINSVFAGLNGENFGAKEWGVAYLRSKDRFEEQFQLEHPVDCLGDAGAALGPILMVLAAVSLYKSYLQGPCLVWCSSDYGTRAATLIALQ